MSGKNRERTEGFGALGTIIAVLVVLFIGLIGWRIYDASKSQPSATITPNQTESKVEPAQEALADPNAGYVVVEQWGVRFKPSESLGEVRYFKPKDLPHDAFTFTTKALADNSDSCASSSENIILGLLYRNREQAAVYGDTLAKIGDYYYQYRGPQSTCGAGNDELEVSALRQLTESLRSLEAAK